MGNYTYDPSEVKKLEFEIKFPERSPVKELLFQVIRTPVYGIRTFEEVMEEHIFTIKKVVLYSKQKRLGNKWHTTIDGFIERFGRLPNKEDRIFVIFNPKWFLRPEPGDDYELGISYLHSQINYEVYNQSDFKEIS